MNKIFKVAHREYVESVKTKGFIIGILMVPFIIGGIIFFTSRMASNKTGPRPPVIVAVADLSNELADEIKNSFGKYNEKNPQRQINVIMLETREGPESADKQGRNKLRQGQVGVYAALDSNILEVEGFGKIRLYTYKLKASDFQIPSIIEDRLREAVINHRYKTQSIPKELLDKLSEIRKVPVERLEMGSSDKEDRVERGIDKAMKMMVPFCFMYLIFMGIVGSGHQMLNSVIEEKNSRIIEVLLSAVSPFELMAGKILGLCAISFTVVILWAVAAYITILWQGLKIEVTAELAIYFVVYYILGFFLISSILAAIGSICNTIKETQSLMTPIIMVLILPVLGWFKMVQDPNGLLSRVLSFLPPLTPMVMILRICSDSDVPKIEIIASILLLAATVYLAIWVAAKIFRTGILMYGKRPGVREIYRWLVQS
ncbi:MAG: ABC transporter permease [Phycisphaerales bacterium]|jgi:ABC-2 type transport system permease protein